MVVDSYACLAHPSFDRDVHEVVRRARYSGVEIVLSAGAANLCGASAERTLELARTHDAVYAAIGIRPKDAASLDSRLLNQLNRWLGQPKVSFLGGIGLDYSLKDADRESQLRALTLQLRIARERRLPLALHCRGAWRDLVRILQEEAGGRRYCGFLHDFAGSPKAGLELAGMGLLLSFSGRVARGVSGNLARLLAGLRLDQVLVETDAPHRALPSSGRRSEPADAVAVARALAQAMDVTFTDVARNTTRNFRKLAGLPLPRDGDILVYQIRDRLYVNLTNRCTARCVFCRRESDPVASGYDLSLSRDYSAAEYLEAIGDPRHYAEIVFCGFGEPTLRLPELVEIARFAKSHGVRTRVNTNGHGNLIHGRNIVPELAPCLDEVSVSIDTADPQSYEKLVRPDFGPESFRAVIDFILLCKVAIPQVTITVVDLPTVDLEACRRLAQELGVEFRGRAYQPMVGSTDFLKE